tara:strand:+ start:233 stop:535 length:303 start_codon:yes stop_codon:yes gene_type:complete
MLRVQVICWALVAIANLTACQALALTGENDSCQAISRVYVPPTSIGDTGKFVNFPSKRECAAQASDIDESDVQTPQREIYAPTDREVLLFPVQETSSWLW